MTRRENGKQGKLFTILSSFILYPTSVYHTGSTS